MLSYLLELDPSLANKTDKDGDTPVHCACKAKSFNREAIEALVRVEPKLINKQVLILSTSLKLLLAVGYSGKC